MNVDNSHHTGSTGKGTLNGYFYFFHMQSESKMLYSLCQKKRTFNSDFFGGPPGGGGPKIHMVYYVNGNFWPPFPRGATKNMGLNVRFFWHRLYIGLATKYIVVCFNLWCAFTKIGGCILEYMNRWISHYLISDELPKRDAPSGFHFVRGRRDPPKGDVERRDPPPSGFHYVRGRK